LYEMPLMNWNICIRAH